MKPSRISRPGAVFPLPVRRRGFSLTELLVSMSVLGALVAFLGVALPSALVKARNAQCMAKMKNLGNAMFFYMQENEGEFPRSFHSAGRAGRDSWAKEILPYLGESSSNANWEQSFNKHYRCPEDKKRDVNSYSYGLNVFFELTPDGDDYEGAPATWRRPLNLAHASKTILLAEPRATSYADHIMSHMWSRANAASTAVDATRHGKKTSNFLFADGHAESQPISSTYDPTKGINLWNPSLAGR